MLNCIDSTSKNPLPVIYQSGYLTIKGYDERFDIYRLGFPNREVEEGFIRYLLPFYANIDKGQTGFHITRFVSEVEQGDCDAFFLLSVSKPLPHSRQILTPSHKCIGLSSKPY